MPLYYIDKREEVGAESKTSINKLVGNNLLLILQFIHNPPQHEPRKNEPRRIHQEKFHPSIKPRIQIHVRASFYYFRQEIDRTRRQMRGREGDKEHQRIPVIVFAKIQRQ